MTAGRSSGVDRPAGSAAGSVRSGSAGTGLDMADRASLEGRKPADWPLVTVTVLAYNRRDAVRDTLTKLLGDLDYPREGLEIIVVDNASTDGTAEMVESEFPAVRVLGMPENLGAPALNRAFAQARGEWVLILDDDCWIDGPALKLAISSAEATGSDLVSFRVRSGVDPAYYFSQGYTMGLFGFWGCAWIISRRALAVLVGYDPNIFIWGNEVELTMRFLSAGFRHLYLPDVVAVHMKAPPSGAADFHRHGVSMRHWSYAAAKLLQPGDAVRVIGRLLATIAIDAVVMSPRAAGSFWHALRGAVDGLRVREPVRSQVSAIYRSDFVSFANPVIFIRTPRQRWRARGERSGIAADTGARYEAFLAQRRRYYPIEAGVLEV